MLSIWKIRGKYLEDSFKYMIDSRLIIRFFFKERLV